MVDQTGRRRWSGAKGESEMSDNWRIKCQTIGRSESVAYETVSTKMCCSHNCRLGRVLYHYEGCRGRGRA